MKNNESDPRELLKKELSRVFNNYYQVYEQKRVVLVTGKMNDLKDYQKLKESKNDILAKLEKSLLSNDKYLVDELIKVIENLVTFNKRYFYKNGYVEGLDILKFMAGNYAFLSKFHNQD